MRITIRQPQYLNWLKALMILCGGSGVRLHLLIHCLIRMIARIAKNPQSHPRLILVLF